MAEEGMPGEYLGPDAFDGGQILGDGYPGGPACSGPNCGGCDTCGPMVPCGVWARGEYLLWGTKGMSVPALVTTSPPTTARANAGVLDVPGTSVLFGDGTLNSNARSGARVTIGSWLDGCQKVGIEGDYWALNDQHDDFHRSSNGVTILARPFYDVLQGEESAELVAFPNVVQGSVGVAATTSLQGAGLRTIINLCCGQSCGPAWFGCGGVPVGYRYDAIVGYRWARLDDSLAVTENLNSLLTASPGQFFIQDQFRTTNQFNGIDLGTAMHFRRGCWSLDVLSKVALGSVHSTLAIAGNTAITQAGVTTNNTGGLLAQRTNIGNYSTNSFAMMPELGFTGGYQINPCWRMTAGYTFLYWSKVYRAGDQIDRNVNTNLLPPETPVQTTHLQPQFNRFACDDFWAQGLTLGMECIW